MTTLSALLLTSVLAFPSEPPPDSPNLKPDSLEPDSLEPAAKPDSAVTMRKPATSGTVLLEFSSPSCHYCRVMQTTVDRLQENGFPVRVVNVERDQQLAQRFQARFLPTFVLVHNGQEVARHEGATSYKRLAGMFDRLQDQLARGSRLATASPSQPEVRGQSPTGILPNMKMLGLDRTDKPQPPSSEDRPHIVERDDKRARSLAEDVAFAATVRIKVFEQGGHSFGTGTIVDAHDGYALVVTCGHLFREVGKKGKLEVDLFDRSGRIRTVPGRVITFDADKRDIGLVEIQPGITVQPAPVARDLNLVRLKADVFSIGCSQGDDPTVQHSQISAIDKYLGVPNIEVSGQPVVGRSGGGLFTADGQLIGICNAADPQDDEGIYAGLPMIHEELAAVGLQPSGPPAAQPAEALTSQPATFQPTADPQDEAVDEGQVGFPAAQRQPGAPVVDSPLPSGVSQIICIVRTKENPQGQLMVIDNPSPELLAQLKRPGQNAGAVTNIAPQHRDVARADDGFRSIR